MKERISPRLWEKGSCFYWGADSRGGCRYVLTIPPAAEQAGRGIKVAYDIFGGLLWDVDSIALAIIPKNHGQEISRVCHLRHW